MSDKLKILADDNLDETLEKKGFVIVPFLSEKEISGLSSFYYDHHSKVLEGMYATAHSTDLELRLKMNDFIRGIFEPVISRYFVNCNPLGGSYIAKGKGELGMLRPHQDWNIVDETHFRSFNIWVPLVDLNESNGALYLMPGSHKWVRTYRSANIPFAYPEKEEELWQTMTGLRMKAGEALIYDHRLIHASSANSTDEIRLTCVYGIIPEGAEMYYYHQKDASTIEVYRSNPEFFLYGNIFEGPKGLVKHSEISLRKTGNSFFSKLLQKLFPSAKSSP